MTATAYKLPLLLALLSSPAYAELTQAPDEPYRGKSPIQVEYLPDNPQGCSIDAGFNALQREVPQPSGSCNIGFGQSSVGGKKANAAFTGTNNIGFGYHALQGLSTGSNNIAFGSAGSLIDGPGAALSTGSGNLFVGAGAGANYTTTNNNIVFEGEGVVSGNAGNNNILFDGHGGWSGSNDVFLGLDAAYSANFGGQYTTLIGLNVGRLNFNNGAAESNIILIGGDQNTAPNTHDVATTTSNNVISIGGGTTFGTGGNHAGTLDTVIGLNVLHLNAQDSAKQVAFGNNALANSNVGAAQNSAFGYQAGKSLTTGKNNLLIGYTAANTTLTTGSGNIIIGSGLDAAASGTSNEINIGGLLFQNNASTAAPVISACGATPSGSVDAHANAKSGTVTIGGGAVTSCTVTFASAYTTWNHCRVFFQNGSVGGAFSYSLSAITITSGSTMNGTLVDYDCDGL